MKIVLIFFCCVFYTIAEAQLTINPLGSGVDDSPGIGRGGIHRLYTDTIDNVLYAVGAFSSIGGKKCFGIAKWDGQSWDSLGSGIREFLFYDGIQNVKDVVRFQNDIYIAGAFYKCGGKNITALARWNGTEWFEVGGGLTDTSELGFSQWATVFDMEVYNNELYIIGNFKQVGNVKSDGIAKWDGQNWVDLSQGIINPYPVNTYLSLMFYNNELYLAGIGSIGLLKRVGNSWVRVGLGVKGDAWINRLEVYQNKLYVGGYFNTNSGNIDNSFFYTDGSTYFPTAGGVLPSNLFNMEVFKGELYVCGQMDYAGFQPVSRIAKWNGTQWFNTNLSIQNPITVVNTPKDMAVYNGNLIIGGLFSEINGVQTWNIASVDFGTVGVSTINKNAAVKLFPNPAQTRVRIELDNNAKLQEIRMYNSIGQIVLKQNASNENTIDVSKLAKGMYVVHVQSDKGILREKLVVE